MKPSLSIIVPAFNEELNLEPTVKGIINAIKDKIDDYEILIFNEAFNIQFGNGILRFRN